MIGIIGKKLGMTHLYREDGTVVRVTVIEPGDHFALLDGLAGAQRRLGNEAVDRRAHCALHHAFDVLTKCAAVTLAAALVLASCGGDGEEACTTAFLRTDASLRGLK